MSPCLLTYAFGQSTKARLDHGSSSDLTASNQVADLELDQVTAAKLAVDGEVEPRSVSDRLLAIEIEATGLDLLLQQWSLRPDLLSCVTRCLSLHRRIIVRVTQGISPLLSIGELGNAKPIDSNRFYGSFQAVGRMLAEAEIGAQSGRGRLIVFLRTKGGGSLDESGKGHAIPAAYGDLK